MLFALKITKENLDSIVAWNAGVKPDDVVVDTDFYLVTGTSPDYYNEIISENTLRDQFRFVDGERPNEFSEVMELTAN